MPGCCHQASANEALLLTASLLSVCQPDDRMPPSNPRLLGGNNSVCGGVQVGAPARVGLVAPVDVTVPAGNTGLDPSSTNFFQVCSPNPFSVLLASALDLESSEVILIGGAHLDMTSFGNLVAGFEHPDQD